MKLMKWRTRRRNVEGKGRKGRGGRGGSIGAGLSDPPFKNSLTNIKMIKSKTPQPLPSDVDLGSLQRKLLCFLRTLP
jgi:hypothetical protein